MGMQRALVDPCMGRHMHWSTLPVACHAARCSWFQTPCIVLVCPNALQILRSRDLDPPATLASLTNLQRCYLQRRGQRSPGAGAVPPLPGGPWLRGLRWLGANVDTLASSAAVLEEAESLEFVEANESLSTAPFYWRSQPVTVLFAWLARHPSLTQASFHGNCYGGSTPLATLWAPAEHGATWVSAFDSRDFAVHLMQLGRRPGLQLRCSHSALDLTPPMLELMSK